MENNNTAFQMESLEPRQLLSAPDGLSPQQVKHAYGFDQIYFRIRNHWHRGTGAGQTIAIIDAFHAPTIQNDLQVFNAQYGLPDTDASGAPVLTVAMPQGRPPVDTGWASEISLDVEWAHAIAPKAHILLVEAASDSTADLVAAINYARQQPGVVAVSMSWGGDESPFQKADDKILTTPAGHIGGSGLRGGITFVTSSGDTGAPTSWPASSPNVVAVGGTTLHVDSAGNWLSETGWKGSGGGPSTIEKTNSPDVAYDADPLTGFAVYDSTPDYDPFKKKTYVGWQVVAGTSAGAPQRAALIPIADQGRSMQRLGSLENAQTRKALYSFPQDDFHDIVVGNNGFSAGPGYDLVTGRGTPKADRITRDFVSWGNTGSGISRRRRLA
jgi:subtilase family serine protease